MIPFIDLNKQYRRLEPEILAAIKKVLEHGNYILGPEVKELETGLAEFIGSKYCLGCSNGTDALLMALMAYDVTAGDAVITTPFTFFATPETIALTGTTPVFSDIDPDTYNMDPDKLEQTIIRVLAEKKLKLRGIMPVDLFGLCADYPRIMAIAEKYNLFVIQDAAQGLAGEQNGRKAPSMGHIGCTSFFPAKPLGAYGDGGAVFTDDPELYAKLHSILVHGRGSDKYNNIRLGLNARLDTIQAAILLQKFKIYPEEIELRQQVAGNYCRELSGLVKTPFIPAGYKSVWAQFCVQSAKRNVIQSALKQADIPTAIYYPIPMHLLDALKYLGYGKGDFPVAEEASEKIFALPMHPYLDKETIKNIAGVIASCV